MTDRKGRNRSDVPDWTAPLDEVVVASSALAGTAAGGPLVGVAAAAGGKLAATGLRKLIAWRADERARLFEDEVTRALGLDADEASRRFADDPRFAEVLFQNYRRAMDAIAPESVPVLARLVGRYQNRDPDQFFRGAGRLLQDVGGDELLALGTIVMGCLAVGAPVVDVTPWKAPSGRYEIRYSPTRGFQRPGEPADPSNHGQIKGTIAPPGLTRVLWLLHRDGLCYEPERSGVDLAMAGETALARETVEWLAALVDASPVTVFDSSFDRPEEPGGVRPHSATTPARRA